MVLSLGTTLYCGQAGLGEGEKRGEVKSDCFGQTRDHLEDVKEIKDSKEMTRRASSAQVEVEFKV